VERCNPRKLRELEVRKQYQVKISNRLTALENLNDSEDKNRAWKNIIENIKTSVEDSLGQHELKQQKPWFAEECLRFLDQIKQAKMQWLRNSKQSNMGNLNNVRPESRRHIKNKMREPLKTIIDEFETKKKKKNIRDLCRGISDFKKSYQP
jgi:hypothetical protein